MQRDDDGMWRVWRIGFRDVGPHSVACVGIIAEAEDACLWPALHQAGLQVRVLARGGQQERGQRGED